MNGSEAVLYRIKKEFLVKKKLNISVLGAGALLLLSACGRSDVTSHSTGLWERLILMFGKAIQGLSFGGSIGLGIIIFTILIRAVMIPLYNRQIKSSRELQELQPELRRLQSEYPGRENREALAYAQQDLYCRPKVMTSSPSIIQSNCHRHDLISHELVLPYLGFSFEA